MTLTIFCALCDHSREQHFLAANQDDTTDAATSVYCLAYCPCNGSATFQCGGIMTPSEEKRA